LSHTNGKVGRFIATALRAWASMFCYRKAD
jgi:hypothetical protein